MLDTIGWLPGTQTETVVTIAVRHVAQLARLLADLEITICDRLDDRADLDRPEQRAEVDEQIEANRVTAHGLVQILQACRQRDR